MPPDLNKGDANSHTGNRSGSVDPSDLLNRLTTLQWQTAAELAKEIAVYRRHTVSVTRAEQELRALERAGKVERRPRQEASGYGVAEFRLAGNSVPRESSVPLWSPHTTGGNK